MPKVTVRVFAALRELLGKRIIELDVAVDDVEGIIRLITDTYQPNFKNAIINPQTGQIRKGFSVLLNGRDISSLEGLRTRLQDGDAIALFSPVAGG
jgi:molybdopterin synthase sulfur carrier subunit